MDPRSVDFTHASAQTHFLPQKSIHVFQQNPLNLSLNLLPAHRVKIK